MGGEKCWDTVINILCNHAVPCMSYEHAEKKMNPYRTVCYANKSSCMHMHVDTMSHSTRRPVRSGNSARDVGTFLPVVQWAWWLMPSTLKEVWITCTVCFCTREWEQALLSPTMCEGSHKNVILEQGLLFITHHTWHPVQPDICIHMQCLYISCISSSFGLVLLDWAGTVSWTSPYGKIICIIYFLYPLVIWTWPT